MTKTPEPSRRERKAALEAAIEQQRVDLLVAAGRWHEAGRSIDAGWQVVRRYRTPALVLASLLLLPVVRRPGAALRLGRRLMVGALTAQRLYRLLPRTR